MNEKDLFVIIGGTVGIALLATLAVLGLTTKKYVPESPYKPIIAPGSDDPTKNIYWGGVTKRRKHKKNKRTRK